MRRTILNLVIGLLTLVDHGHAASVKNKDDPFMINITMPNFNTTQVKSIDPSTIFVNGDAFLG
jgi:hypothetical protein